MGAPGDRPLRRTKDLPTLFGVSQTPHSDTVTRGVRVQAAAQYLPQDSSPDEKRNVYAYRITLINEGDRPVRLLSRHWIIVDADGCREDVQGPGVVGEFPHLQPGENFQYVSGCPLSTPWGTMEGKYSLEYDDGERFEIRIGRFFLVPSAPPLEQPI